MKLILPVVFVVFTSVANSQEFTTDAAKQAKADYEADLKAAKDKYKESVNRAAVKAAEASDLDEVIRIKQTKDVLDGKVVNKAGEAPPKPEEKRDLWIKDDNAGFFERLNTKRHWIERVNNDAALFYHETDRTDEYVEISLKTLPFPERVIRLYSDHFMMKNARGEIWKRIRGGKWTKKD